MRWTIQSNSGNGKSDEPEIGVSFEPIDDETEMVQDRWVEADEMTGEREIVFGDQVRDQLGIEEEDEDTESN